MKDDDSKKLTLITRRVFLLFVGKISLIFIIISRMLYLQFFKSKEYQIISDNNRTKISLIVPERGKIFDKFHNSISYNKKMFRVFLNREAIKTNISSTVNNLCEILSYTDAQKQFIQKRIKNASPKQNILLIDNLSWDQLSKIEFYLDELPGILVENGQIRFYPYSNILSHIIGYVGPISELQLLNNPFTSHPDLKVGKNGLEKYFNEFLSGTPGIKKTEVNAQGKIVKELSIEKSTSGKNLFTTLDLELQQFVYDKLGDKMGSIVVMDVTDGSILSMVSNPSFNPNLFSTGISKEDWVHLIRDPDLPLTNKAISLVYPPGSIFKLVTGLAGLKNNISPNFTINCPGYFMMGEKKLHCNNQKAHGHVNIVSAIKVSCNAYFATIAKIIGIENITAMAASLGLGSKVLGELPREHPGLLPSKEWKIAQVGKAWTLGDTLNCAIGQGYLLVTPIQLCTLISRIASGKNILPYLVINNTNHHYRDLDIPISYLNIIREGTYLCANSPGGTAYGHRITDEKFLMAGKTSTPQVISKRRADEDLNLITNKKFRNHGIFAGYAPFDNPRFACTVMIENIGGAGKTLPLAHEILLYVQKKYATMKG